MSVHIDNFETIFGVKDNIQELRNKVLELAIHGKLVEQDPNDEPASELIRKIRIERDRLVKEGKIKKRKPLKLIEESEIPFEIPENWKWVRLGEICYKIVDGSHNPPKGIEGDGYPMLSAININKTIDFDKPSRLISSKDFKREHNRTNIGRNDVLLTIVGTIGRAVVVDIDELFTLQRSVAAIKTGISPYYLQYLLLSPSFYNQMYEEAKGTAQVGIYLGTLNSLKIPVPPIAEQYRIVTKIESLMTEIDKLEETLQKKEHLKELLPKAVVEAIGSCKTGEELKEQLQFVIENFRTVFQTPNSMQELRNVVLQLAIEGKIVPQDGADEPASVLIKKIHAEKDELIKEGKLKKQKPHKAIEKDEIPFEIPESWKWMRLGEIANLIMGQSPDGSMVTENAKNGIEFHQGKTNFGTKILNISGKYTSAPKKICPKDSLLISVRAPVGTLNYTNREICIGRGLSALIPFKEIQTDYLYSAVTALEGWLVENSTGTTFKAITGEVLSSLLLPVPPYKEQVRIVEKIESIMSLIDQMEDQLNSKDELVKKLAV